MNNILRYLELLTLTISVIEAIDYTNLTYSRNRGRERRIWVWNKSVRLPRGGGGEVKEKCIIVVVVFVIITYSGWGNKKQIKTLLSCSISYWLLTWLRTIDNNNNYYYLPQLSKCVVSINQNNKLKFFNKLTGRVGY